MRKFNWMLLVLLFVGCGNSPTVTSESDDFNEIVAKINDVNEKLKLLDKKFEQSQKGLMANPNGNIVASDPNPPGEAIQPNDCLETPRIPNVGIGIEGVQFFVAYVSIGPEKELRDLSEKIKFGMGKKEIWEVFGGSPSLITAVQNEDKQFWFYGEHFKLFRVNPIFVNGAHYLWLLFSRGKLFDKRVIVWNL